MPILSVAHIPHISWKHGCILLQGSGTKEIALKLQEQGEGSGNVIGYRALLAV